MCNSCLIVIQALLVGRRTLAGDQLESPGSSDSPLVPRLALDWLHVPWRVQVGDHSCGMLWWPLPPMIPNGWFPLLRCIPQGCACKTAEEREEQENQLRDAIRSLHTYVAHSCWAAGNYRKLVTGSRLLQADFAWTKVPSSWFWLLRNTMSLVVWWITPAGSLEARIKPLQSFLSDREARWSRVLVVSTLAIANHKIEELKPARLVPIRAHGECAHGWTCARDHGPGAWLSPLAGERDGSYWWSLSHSPVSCCFDDVRL